MEGAFYCQVRVSVEINSTKCEVLKHITKFTCQRLSARFYLEQLNYYKWLLLDFRILRSQDFNELRTLVADYCLGADTEIAEIVGRKRRESAQPRRREGVGRCVQGHFWK